jgi:hypothetical protein
VYDPFTNQTEGRGAPPYSCLEITKTIVMTPIAFIRMTMFFCESRGPHAASPGSQPRALQAPFYLLGCT